MFQTKLPLPALLTATTILLALAIPNAAVAGPNQDIDGDGYDDLLVGVPRSNDNNNANTGTAALYFGGGSGLNADEIFVPRVHGGERAGASVAVGDFNCDGTPDLAMGAPLDHYNEDEAGLVFLYMSTSEGYVRTATTRSDYLGNPPEEEGDHFGRSIVAADFDDDGCDDLAIGAPGASVVGTTDNTGLVYIARGGNGGLTAWQNVRPDVTGGQDARFGFSLAAGDMNDDGVDDLLIGASTWVIDNRTVGAAQVRSFDGNSFDPIIPIVTPCAPGSCDASDAWHWFGWSLAAGDFNGDGHADLAVGWPGKNPQVYTGSVEIFETNGAGTVTNQRSVSVGSGQAQFGYSMDAGDVDSDGIDDLVVGAPFATVAGGPNLSGAAYVLTNGLAQYQTLSPTDYSTPTADKQRFGSAVSFGNYLGGGFDLVVGAQRAKDQSGVRGGGAYVYENLGGTMSAMQKLGIEDFSGESAIAGALFGASLSH